jgi:hypothetical protein
MNRKFTSSLFLVIGMSLGLLAASASAGTLNLADQNSTASITPSSSAGLTSWTVNGLNVAAKQWFYYAIGSTAPSSLDTLGLTSSGTFVFGSGTRGGFAIYTGSNGLSAEVDYILTGGGTNATQSDLSETIRLTNTGTADKSVHFYQYSNFNLSQGTSDMEQFTNANTVTQQFGNTLQMQTVTTPAANEWEGSLTTSSTNTLGKLTGGSPVTLSNTPPLGGIVGPGNVTWAYQWDPTIKAGSTYIISNDQQITPPNVTIPEPATPVLLAAAGLALMGVRLRRRWLRL